MAKALKIFLFFLLFALCFSFVFAQKTSSKNEGKEIKNTLLQFLAGLFDILIKFFQLIQEFFGLIIKFLEWIKSQLLKV